MGSAVLYPMALLRIADYLQIDGQRAPAVLLNLKNPQSPVSVQEWKKHRAIQSIGPHNDPRGKAITVSPDISQAIYLQLRDLLAGLQAEMDHATAVLDETYGAYTIHGLDQLNLATRRVYSNLHSPVFQNNLPYVPERTAFNADPNLLTLLVEPLYGKEQGVGVRELMQNAVDAVCELHAWCENHGVSVESLDLPEQDSDVQIDFIQREDKTWFLRVTDKGIGMTAETIQNYFLRAGASFRQSADWAKEFLDDGGKPRVLRAGRFGIGVFAVFLLGPNFRLWTRYVGAEKIHGYYVEASKGSELIEIRRESDLSVGTTIEVECSRESAERLELDENEYINYKGPGSKSDWFCWNWPVINRRVIRRTSPEISLPQEFVADLRKTIHPPEWSVIHPSGFDAVYWTFWGYPSISCNGMIIDSLESSEPDYNFNWTEETQLRAPIIAVLDSSANLPLTTQRYALSDRNLPFINELSRDITLSFIAHALVCGPSSRAEVEGIVPIEKFKSHPLVMHDSPRDFDGPYSPRSLLRWCSSFYAVIPADPWLYSLLRTNTCLVFGTGNIKSEDNLRCFQKLLPSIQLHKYQTILPWNAFIMDGIGGIQIDDIIDPQKDILSFAEYFTGSVKSYSQIFRHEDVVDMQLLVAFTHYTCFREPCIEDFQVLGGRKFNLNQITPQNTFGKYFLIQTETAGDSLSLDHLIESIELFYWKNQICTLNPFYVAEIKTQPSNPHPETLLAKIWNECLGPQPIPFDPEARSKLIEHGRQHPELKRHIEAWEEMKHTGSKWVVGDAED